jgi:hypothetical protein
MSKCWTVSAGVKKQKGQNIMCLSDDEIAIALTVSDELSLLY